MTRPSRNQDRLLIEAARKLIPKVGVSEMSIKMLSDEAGVNQGIFYYHFKSKSEFIRIVLESFMDEAQKEIKIKIPINLSSIEKLQYYLFSIGKVYCENIKFAVLMYRDLLNKDPVITEYQISLIEYQNDLYRPLIEECQKDDFIQKHYNLQDILSYCLSVIKGPIVLSEVINMFSDNKSEYLNKIKEELITEEAISRRAEMAVMGIASEKGRNLLMSTKAENG
jgi:AcrR family transcriptional regulator